MFKSSVLSFLTIDRQMHYLIVDTSVLLCALKSVKGAPTHSSQPLCFPICIHVLNVQLSTLERVLPAMNHICSWCMLLCRQHQHSAFLTQD